MKLNELAPGRGARHKVKRLGRGDATGHGGTSTRGHKGQRSRSGGYHKRGFEGGQMPLQRRIPKKGFTNIFRKEYAIVNLDQLNCFEKGIKITPALLMEKGLVKDLKNGLKVLGRGDLKNALNVQASKFSSEAKKKIEASGGSIEVI